MTKKTCSSKLPQPNPSTHHILLTSILATAIELLLSPPSSAAATAISPPPPPLPILPIPSRRQISWQLSDMALFFHFGINTFTDSEWGTGRADPTLFNPTRLNAGQWIAVAKAAGFGRVILTAKHHDGFCLWPSDYTDYSVKSSPWRNGAGDVVGELAAAARAAGVQMGIYLSPWDRHDSSYGKTLPYNEYYLGQMTELLSRYGEIREVFLDGAKGEGEKDMKYFFDEWFDLIHQHQPMAAIFSDAGPDTRWIGNELGSADATCWSLLNQSSVEIGHGDAEYLGQGDPNGRDWVPAECDVSIRPGWFWHASESPKPASALLDLYYKSVGRNCLLLLNVPPNSSGLISPEDIKALEEFSDMRTSIFSDNLAQRASISASTTRGNLGDDSRYGAHNILIDSIYSYWAPNGTRRQSSWTLFLDFPETISFNVLLVQEPIQMGQRIAAFRLDFLNESGEWEKATNGTTVGFRRLLLFPFVKARRLRLLIEESRAAPLISYVGLYVDRFSVAGDDSTAHVHIEQTIRQNISRFDI
ncbi:alpha-L-fucosidase 1 [Andrographis paniculata]|uniref:alpha-L-fucosidase 1 n=1 Tax=Andrographis paniculata TaxID=175694 RepID=UPI0021E7AD1E|nr:alpha-L-fucosidase 1 [Andrographis paniculata]